MDFGDSPDEAAFRHRFRAWLVDNTPDLPPSSTDDAYWAGVAPWHRALYDAGFFGLSWPREVGVFMLVRTDHIEHALRFAVGTAIYAGTSEVQRNIIAQQRCRLPRA